MNKRLAALFNTFYQLIAVRIISIVMASALRMVAVIGMF